MVTPIPRRTLTLPALVRLLYEAGAPDEVTERFIDLYRSATEGDADAVTPLLRTVAFEAAQAAVDLLTSQARQGQVPDATSSRPVDGCGFAGDTGKTMRARAPAPRAPHSHIVHVHIGTRRTSVSVPTDLYQQAVAELGEQATTGVIADLAATTPENVRRSFHVQQGLRKAVEGGVDRHQPPQAVQ